MTAALRRHFVVSHVQGFAVAVEAHHVERIASPTETFDEGSVLDVAALFAPQRARLRDDRSSLVCRSSVVLRVGGEVSLVSFDGAPRPVPALLSLHLAKIGVQQLLLNAGALLYVLDPRSLDTPETADGITKLSTTQALGYTSETSRSD